MQLKYDVYTFATWFAAAAGCRWFIEALRSLRCFTASQSDRTALTARCSHFNTRCIVSAKSSAQFTKRFGIVISAHLRLRRLLPPSMFAERPLVGASDDHKDETIAFFCYLSCLSESLYVEQYYHYHVH